MTSSSEGELLQSNQTIRDRWRIKSKVGGGGFGEIYEASDIQNHNEKVAVKVESSKATKQVLKMEVAVLRRLQGKRHACKFYGCGRNDKFNYLVMSMQGKNLADLRRESPKQSFTISTAIRLGLQILNAIQEIHSIGFLHRDIKPSNFAMGRTGGNVKTVYMLDFGLARQYLNAKGEIRSPRSAAGFRGTVRYAAVSAHKNREMGRQDDLWSLFYMLVEFLQSALPWRKIKDKDEVGRLKEEVDLEFLLEGCPHELLAFANHLKTLTYPDEPDYNMLEGCLTSIINRMGISMDDPYDWEIGYENLGKKSQTLNGTSNRNKSHTTAVKDRGPDDKNKNLDTQAPITMGEDEDEETGNYFARIPGIPDVDVCKPKYKRQEFMRPKYGAVSFDVFDAVNARLNAVNNSAINSTSDLFQKMKVDVSIENNVDNNELNVPVIKSIKDNRSNRSMTNSVGKRCNDVSLGKMTKKQPCSSTVNDTNAIAEDEGIGSVNKNTALISMSRCHESFDETGYDEQFLGVNDHHYMGDRNGSRSPMNGGLRPFPRNGLANSPTVPILSGTPSSTPSNNLSNSSKSKNTTQQGQPLSRSPTVKRRFMQQSQSHYNLANGSNNKKDSKEEKEHSSSTAERMSLMSHFKNLVSSFSNGAANHIASRRRSLSRGISLDDRQSAIAAVAKHSTNTAAAISGGNVNNNTSSSKSNQSPNLNYKNSSNGLIKPSLTSTKIVATTNYYNKPNTIESIGESRILKRFSRKESNSNKNERNESPGKNYKQALILNGSDDKNGYLVEAKVLNNGISDEGKDLKNSLSCRRKRYQFLNFSHRASTKS
uniref:Protein kinase domain-containing protein n=1 Tax=Parastrongyloides trichosuri TaxID=131310 RepID=A0A0N4ZVU4_PARTI